MGMFTEEGRDLSGICYSYLLMFQQKSKAFFQTSHNSGRTKKTIGEFSEESRPNKEERCSKTILGEKRIKSTSLTSANSYCSFKKSDRKETDRKQGRREGEHKVNSSQNKLLLVVVGKNKQVTDKRKRERNRKIKKKKTMDGNIVLIPPKLKW